MNTTQLFKGALVVALIGTVLAFAGTTMAATIVQDVGADYLAFEAENFDSVIDLGGDGVNWTVISEAGASGGEAVKAPGLAVNTFGNEGELVYNVQFTEPAEGYRAYVRFRNLGNSGSDSILLPQDWLSGLTTRTGTLGRVDNTIGPYFWASLGPMGSIAPGTYEFRMGIREADAEVDRFVFAKQSFLNTTGRTQSITSGTGLTLDGLANSSHTDIPEPASFGLLALGMLAVGGMRRRQG